MNLSFHFEHDYAKDMITIKKEKIKREEKEERFKYFEKCNIKKYYNKEEFQHFSFACLKIFI